METKLQTRRAALVTEREKYNYELEDKEVHRLTLQLNQAVDIRNRKKSLWDLHDKEIKRIDDMVAYVDELEKTELPEEPIEEPIEPTQEEVE